MFTSVAVNYEAMSVSVSQRDGNKIIERWLVLYSPSDYDT